MTVFPSDPTETFSHFFSELFSAATLKAKRDNYSAKQKNQLLKDQVGTLSKEVLKRRNCENSTFFE